MREIMRSFLLFATVTVSLATPVTVESAAFCADNLEQATASIQSSRLRLIQLEGASNAEVCAALHRHVDVLKAARVVFVQCLTGPLRRDLFADADASLAHLESTLPILCSE
jgi:phosphoribosylanthranilate isomerase